MSFTSAPVIKRVVWQKDKLPAAELQRRLSALKELAVQKSLAGVFVYGDVINSGSLSYFTNYTCHIAWRGGLLYVPVKGDPVLYLKVPARDVPYIQEVTPVEVKVCGGIAEATQKIPKTVGDRFGLVDFDVIPYLDVIKMESKFFGEAAEDLSATVHKWRSKKSEIEKSILREGAAITSKAVSVLLSAATGGATLQSIGAEADYYARRRGSQEIQVLYGVNERNMQPVYDYSLLNGDLLRVNLSVQYLGYWTSMARTVQIGRGENFNGNSVLMDAEADLLEKIISSYKTGTKTAFKENTPDVGIGGGIGLQLEEYPTVSDSDCIPGKDMVLNLRVGFDLNGIKIMRGDTVIIGEEKIETITTAGGNA